MERRDFITRSVWSLTGLAVAGPVLAAGPAKFSALRFGICADLHQDIIPDAPERLSAFIADMKQKNPDFIIQMGDFCTPKDQNRGVMDIWNRFQGPRHHVIGNHDTDGGFNRDQVVQFWNASGKYYSFDLKGYHFVVLDTNENEHNPLKNPQVKYSSYVGDTQLQWLEADLEQTKLPVIVFCHHGLDNDQSGVENAVAVRTTLERANDKSGFRKVLLVFSGHHHQDYWNMFNGICYVQINSISYKWLGTKYGHVPYTEEINKKHPLMKFVVPYKDPIWAMIDISSGGQLKITGRRTVFVGQSPAELGVPAYENIYPIVPYISDRTLKLALD